MTITRFCTRHGTHIGLCNFDECFSRMGDTMNSDAKRLTTTTTTNENTSPKFKFIFIHQPSLLNYILYFYTQDCHVRFAINVAHCLCVVV